MKTGWTLEGESCITKKMQGVHSLMGDRAEYFVVVTKNFFFILI